MTAYTYLNINNPWIAWLVYRGEMVSAKVSHQSLSVWHTFLLIDNATAQRRQDYYKMEQAIENERVKSFNKKVSRLTGMYFFEDLKPAETANKSWGNIFKKENLVEVEFSNCAKVSKYDSEWITHYKSSSQDELWIKNYLSGKATSDNPIWELLIEGRGFILNTEVRQRAYETIKRIWPRSLGLLELSRVAVELNSDLGLIKAFITKEKNVHRISIAMNFIDATNKEFLDRFSKYNGPKNTNDLNAKSELVQPDLSQYFVTIRT